MKASHPCEKPVHAVLPRDLSRLREVIDLLILCQSLISLRLDVAAGPHDCVLLIPLGRLPKTVVLEQVPDQAHFHTVIHLEVISFVLRFVGPYTYRIDVGSEAHILLKLAVENTRLLHEKSVDRIG